MGPYGSVGAHIKTGRSPMAQDHFKTPPDPKKGHGMTKNPQKSKKSSRVGQGLCMLEVGAGHGQLSNIVYSFAYCLVIFGFLWAFWGSGGV